MAQKGVLTTSDYLPYEEYKRFIGCLHKEKLYMWEAYAELSFCTACRFSDVSRLRWCDILDKQRITITEQKTGKTRSVKISLSAQQKFRSLYELLHRPDKDGYILSRGSNGEKPMGIIWVNKKLKEFKYKYNLKIENFSTHTFRKTFGRYVYESHNRSAESLILLNKILNHYSIAVTKAYIGITQNEIDGIFDSIQL